MALRFTISLVSSHILLRGDRCCGCGRRGRLHLGLLLHHPVLEVAVGRAQLVGK